MKAIVITTMAAGLLVGCASREHDRVATASGPAILQEQPQSAIAGQGSLMPGAYSSRPLPTGQFTGRERTNDQIGQRPTMPREADARDLARSEEGLSDGARGAGTLGQSGIVPDRGVSAETLMETTASPVGAPAHVVVTPPGSDTEPERIAAEAVGSPAGAVTGSSANTNAPVLNNSATNAVPRPEYAFTIFH